MPFCSMRSTILGASDLRLLGTALNSGRDAQLLAKFSIRWSNDPLDRLDLRCQAAAEHQVLAYSGATEGGRCSRIVFPFWGEGRVSMLLVAIAP